MNPRDTSIEQAVARLLMLGTYISVAILAVGVVLLLLSQVSPLQGGPLFDPARLVVDLLAVRPEGFLWLGLVLVIATPSARVVASLIGYLGRSERSMAAVAVGILAVIAGSVAISLIAGTEL
jgi:uncharacterized membrane protein